MSAYYRYITKVVLKSLSRFYVISTICVFIHKCIHKCEIFTRTNDCVHNITFVLYTNIGSYLGRIEGNNGTIKVICFIRVSRVWEENRRIRKKINSKFNRDYR